MHSNCVSNFFIAALTPPPPSRISMTSQELQSLMDEVSLEGGVTSGLSGDVINEEALDALHSEPLIEQVTYL